MLRRKNSTQRNNKTDLTLVGLAKTNMNSTEKSMQRIYSYLTSALERPLPARRPVRYLPLVPSDFANALHGEEEANASILLGAILENQESRQYQKCLSRLNVEMLPAILN